MAQRTGKCRICGIIGPLTFEHVPPRAAFNDRRAFVLQGMDVLQLHWGQDVEKKKKILQRGVGEYTLCARCNNNTGSWYGDRFARFCHSGFDLLLAAGLNPTLCYPMHFFPLAVIKQVATMFFSVNADSFADCNQELVRFVLNKEAKYLPDPYRIYAYLNLTGVGRYVGTAAMTSLDGHAPVVMSEISHIPYGFLMTMDSRSPDERLCDISFFGNYAYQEFKTIPLRLPAFELVTGYPGQYLTRKGAERFRERRKAAPKDGNSER